MRHAAPGAYPLADGSCRFVVWAPFANAVEVRLHAPQQQRVRLKKEERGYHVGIVPDVPVGARYTYVLDDRAERPDPASRYQPDGVHGSSEVCRQDYAWRAMDWRGLPLTDYIIYELHVGTFTPDGTFEAVVSHLPRLKDLGVTAVELMPVSQFPGDRNWGYDGVYPYAVQDSYGGPPGLMRLVDACHELGLAVVLDVVYNHFGPEGNYTADFGPYFSDTYRTPWGKAINFDGAGSDEVRTFFIGNALYWLEEYRMDALRLDALHAILDISPHPFLQELAEAISDLRSRSGRRIYLIGESDLNDPRLIRRTEESGIGLDAQWSDDFHHSLHVTLTGDEKGYYADFAGAKDLAHAMNHGFVYTGQYSQYRNRRHGAPAHGLPPERFVVCAQNHDQVGNRKHGDRLSTLVSLEQLKLAAASVVLAPYIPLLFMGEEYGETAAFPYFVSHSDAELVEAVRKGRAAEFSSFEWGGNLPDPQDEATFKSAKLHPYHALAGDNRALLDLYKELIRLRKALPALSCMSGGKLRTTTSQSDTIITVVREDNEGSATALIMNCGAQTIATEVPVPEGQWITLVDTANTRWNGPGSQALARLDSRGSTGLSLAAWSALLLAKEGRTG